LPHEFESGLEVEIQPLTADLLAQLGNPLDGLPSAIAALVPLAGHRTLTHVQFLPGLPQMSTSKALSRISTTRV
jgi:hypothetical protein